MIHEESFTERSGDYADPGDLSVGSPERLRTRYLTGGDLAGPAAASANTTGPLTEDELAAYRELFKLLPRVIARALVRSGFLTVEQVATTPNKVLSYCRLIGHERLHAIRAAIPYVPPTGGHAPADSDDNSAVEGPVAAHSTRRPITGTLPRRPRSSSRHSTWALSATDLDESRPAHISTPLSTRQTGELGPLPYAQDLDRR